MPSEASNRSYQAQNGSAEPSLDRVFGRCSNSKPSDELLPGSNRLEACMTATRAREQSRFRQAVSETIISPSRFRREIRFGDARRAWLISFDGFLRGWRLKPSRNLTQAQVPKTLDAPISSLLKGADCPTWRQRACDVAWRSIHGQNSRLWPA